jgi:hypothetical protein
MRSSPRWAAHTQYRDKPLGPMLDETVGYHRSELYLTTRQVWL